MGAEPFAERTYFCVPPAFQSDSLLRYGVNLYKGAHGVGLQNTETKLQKMKSPSTRTTGKIVTLLARVMINISSIYKFWRSVDNKGMEGRNRSPRPTLVVIEPFLWCPCHFGYVSVPLIHSHKETPDVVKWMSTILKLDFRALCVAFHFRTQLVISI